jgi:GT2 family glycosyltransferase
MSPTRSPISVVIPSFAGRALLSQHLPNVLKQLQPGDELIVVDDASPAPDDTIAWLETFAKQHAASKVRIHSIKHAENKRFAASINTGVADAQHDLIWLLNNDVSPLTPHSVSLAQAWFAQDKTLFAVGCAEVNKPDTSAKKSGRGTGNFARGLLVHWYDPNQSDPLTLWTSGGSMFVDRLKFLKLGGMDTLFAPAYEEDRDLSYRALKRGWNLRHDVSIVVHHKHETTNASVFGNRGIAVTSWKNQFLLVWKNLSDPTLILQHLIWLPYHLTISNLRERGAVGTGFLRALQQLPDVLSARKQESRHWQRSDREILLTYGSTPPKA